MCIMVTVLKKSSKKIKIFYLFRFIDTIEELSIQPEKMGTLLVQDKSKAKDLL